jgi:hypothetical protein
MHDVYLYACVWLLDHGCLKNNAFKDLWIVGSQNFLSRVDKWKSWFAWTTTSKWKPHECQLQDHQTN